MPFRLKAIGAERDGDELVIRGRLLEGAYFGPEAVLLRTIDGHEYPSHIHAHAMEFPEGWPVLPEHRKTVLILRIPALSADVKIVSVVGLGNIVPARQRIDVSDALTQPEFWAMQLNLHFSSEEVDDPAFEWLGIRSAAVEEWYETKIHKPILDGVWPYLRVNLPSSRYIELEMAGGVEYQDRVWIGDQSSTRRVMLGYHSGNFSMPALRVEEVFWLVSMTQSDASNLLWLTTAYLEQRTSEFSLTTSLTARVPGLLPGKAGVMAETLLRNLTVKDLKWVEDQELGWINNWPYSQRNPSSRLSVLDRADFTYAREYFS